MFNEAFWFFYWVSVVTTLSVIFSVTAALGIFFGAFLKGCYHFDNEESALKPSNWLLTIGAICLIGSIFIPPEEALYAGAGQYVIEATETDETLLRLKDIIDEKIEELEGEK